MPNFDRENGKANIVPYKKTASLAFALGDAVMLSSGLLVKANATATPANFVGIINREVSSADADYAQQSFVEVDTPNASDTFVARVGTGTALATMVGNRYMLDANGRVDVTATTTPTVEVVRFLSATQLVVKLLVG